MHSFRAARSIAPSSLLVSGEQELRQRVETSLIIYVLPSLVNASNAACRMRKDPLDPIDSGTKVAIMFKRLTDPEFLKREEAMKKKKEEAEKAAAASNKKAGSWGGLPGRR